MEKIFAFIQKAFEEKYEHISVEEDRIIVKLMINIMEVMTEEITFEHEKIKMICEEEAEFVKESIKLLTEEKVNLKKEVHLLNQFIEEKKPIQKKKKRIKKTEKNQILKIEDSKKGLEQKIE